MTVAKIYYNKCCLYKICREREKKTTFRWRKKRPANFFFSNFSMQLAVKK